MAYKPSHIEELKFNGTDSEQELFATRLRNAVLDKGYDIELLRTLAEKKLFAKLFAPQVLRITDQLLETRINELAIKAFTGKELKDDNSCTTYTGSPEQNQKIDESIAKSPYHKYKQEIDGFENFRITSGRGAMTRFEVEPDLAKRINQNIENTPVVILGGGAAGAMSARALVELGWNPNAIQIIDKTGSFGGIWTYQMVHDGTRNNPKTLTYLGLTLEKAPGEGKEVYDFIKKLRNASTYNKRIKEPIKGTIKSVSPGDLDTKVVYVEDGKEYNVSAPIVINCLGLGKPLPISREGYMTTSSTHAGNRWQQIITGAQAREYNNKRLIFIGLGNSTAEMLKQIIALNTQGHKIDYRVLTHYPEESVNSPDETIEQKERQFRVFRDITKPNLVDYQGDLETFRDAYFTALYAGKIISDVVHWDAKDGKILVKRKRNKSQELEFETLFTLIGYGHSKEDLKQMSFAVDSEKNFGMFDYDGEAQKNPATRGRYRLNAGYFGFGSILNAPHNQNSIVIPGMIHRIGDLMFSVMMRAIEYQSRTANIPIERKESVKEIAPEKTAEKINPIKTKKTNSLIEELLAEQEKTKQTTKENTQTKTNPLVDELLAEQQKATAEKPKEKILPAPLPIKVPEPKEAITSDKKRLNEIVEQLLYEKTEEVNKSQQKTEIKAERDREIFVAIAEELLKLEEDELNKNRKIFFSSPQKQIRSDGRVDEILATPEPKTVIFPPYTNKQIEDLIKRGNPIYHTNLSTALKKTIRYATKNGIVASMPYLIAGKAKADKTNYLWQNWYTALTEEDIGVDKKGIFVEKGKPVLVVAHGGGIWTPERIQKEYEQKVTNRGAGKLTEEEFNELLKGRLQDKREIVMYAFRDFMKMKMPPTQNYGIVINFDVAKSTKSDYHTKEEFMNNPVVIARAGGLEHLEAYFDKAKETYSEKKVGNWHQFNNIDPLQYQGRLLFLVSGYDGLVGDYYLNYYGRFVGVASAGGAVVGARKKDTPKKRK